MKAIGFQSKYGNRMPITPPCTKYISYEIFPRKRLIVLLTNPATDMQTYMNNAIERLLAMQISNAVNSSTLCE